MKFIPRGYQPHVDISGWYSSLFEVVGADRYTTKQIKDQFRKEIFNKGTLHVFKVGETTFITHINPKGGNRDEH